MERAELRFERWQVWVAVLTLALGGAAWGVQIGVSAGQLTARVEAVEKTLPQCVHHDEWQVFTKDLTDRLDRIENKVDALPRGK
jgi:hypothetical protein